jgi:hypothetical protein
LRHVASRARLAWLGGAQPTDETEEIDEAREERELSVIIDSGDEDIEEADGASEGLRLGKWYASRPFLMLGLNWSTQVRARDEHCACCIAVHIEGRRELVARALTAGVELATD